MVQLSSNSQRQQKPPQHFAPAFLYMQPHGNLLVHTPGCLKAVSLIITRIMQRTGKRQILPSSVLRGKIKSWFKHQPKLDRVRHVTFTAAHAGEHINEADKAHPTAHTTLALMQSLLGGERWGNPSAQLLTTARGFPLLLPALKEHR